MKKILLLLSVIAVFAFTTSCKKDDDTKKAETYSVNSLNGTWHSDSDKSVTFTFKAKEGGDVEKFVLVGGIEESYKINGTVQITGIPVQGEFKISIVSIAGPIFNMVVLKQPIKASIVVNFTDKKHATVNVIGQGMMRYNITKE